MGHTVKTKDLQVGMKVVAPIVGVKGDIKVNKGEILSKGHVDKLNTWKGVDAANPKGIEVESSRASGSALPSVVDKPWESPIVQANSKKKLQSSSRVPGIYDENGKLLNPSPLERELEAREAARKAEREKSAAAKKKTKKKLKVRLKAKKRR